MSKRKAEKVFERDVEYDESHCFCIKIKKPLTAKADAAEKVVQQGLLHAFNGLFDKLAEEGRLAGIDVGENLRAAIIQHGIDHGIFRLDKEQDAEPESAPVGDTPKSD